MLTHKGWVTASIAALLSGMPAHGQVRLASTAATATIGDTPTFSSIATREDATDRMTVAVMVNQAGPFRFLIDTGANRTVVSDRLAAALQLPSRPARRLVSVTDTEDVAMAALDSLEVGGVRRDAFEAAVLAEEPLGATGVLGIDNLTGRRIVLDFRHHRMSISANQHVAPADRDPPGTIVVTARRQSGQLILTDAYYRNHRIDVVIDTGGQISIGNLAFLNLIKRRGPALPMGIISSVTGQTAPVQMAILPAVFLGKMSLNDEAIAFADLACFDRFGLSKRPALLLGMDVLRRFDRVAIDFKRRTVSFALPDSRDDGVFINLG